MPILWMRKPRLVGLGDPDSRVWLGNEEMEEDNFHGFALLKSPGGITSNRESFSRLIRNFRCQEFGQSGGGQAACPAFLYSSQPWSLVVEDMEEALPFFDGDFSFFSSGRQAWWERKEFQLGTKRGPFQGTHLLGGFLNPVCPESKLSQGLGLR